MKRIHDTKYFYINWEKKYEKQKIFLNILFLLSMHYYTNSHCM